MSNLLKSLLAAAALAPAVSLADPAAVTTPAPAAVAAPAAPPAAAPPPAATPKVTIGGLVDSYYMLTLDHAQTVADGTRAFDSTPGLRLSYAEMNATVDAGPAGLRLDLGFAPTALGTTNFFVQQAYATYKFGAVTLDFGRFVTSAGAEVIEAKDNWLYSRSLLFTWAIPFAHNGLRVTVPVADGAALQLGVVNGWDDDAISTAGVRTLAGGAPAFGPEKDGNVSFTYAKDAYSAAVNVYAGQEQLSPDFRTLVDVVLGYTAGPVALNLNVDWADQQKNDAAKTGGAWYGASLMAKYQIDPWKFTVRGEYFADADGYRLGGLGAVWGQETDLYEGTAGVGYLFGANAELRAEIRYDGASRPLLAGTNHFTTFEIAALAWF